MESVRRQPPHALPYAVRAAALACVPRGGPAARARPGAAVARGRLRRRRRHPVPPPAGRQSLEHAGRLAAAGPELGGLHRAHEPGDGSAPRLRHRLGRRAHRHPLHRRPRDAAQGADPLHRLRRRERSGSLPRAVQRPGRGDGWPVRGRRPPRARARRRPPDALRALPRLPAGRRLLERRFGGRLRPDDQRAAAGRLDLRGRGRPADPPGPRPVRRDRRRGCARPRAALHRGGHAARLRLSGDALRQRLGGSGPAADGAARAAARRLRRERLPAGRSRRS